MGILVYGSYLSPGKFQKPTKAKELFKRLKKMETKSRSIQGTQAVSDISSEATQRGRRQPLTKECHEKLFVTSGNRGSEVVASQRLEFESVCLD